MALEERRQITTAQPTAPEMQNTTAEKHGFWDSIRNWWDNLAKPTTRTTECILKNARDNMVAAVVFGIAVILFRKSFPTLFVGLGIIEAIAMFLESYSVREAIANGEDRLIAQRRAMRAAGRLITEYMLSVVILTAVAVWVNNGAQWAQDFPTLQILSTYQIEMVSELLDAAAQLFNMI